MIDALGKDVPDEELKRLSRALARHAPRPVPDAGVLAQRMMIVMEVKPWEADQASVPTPR
jgi:hypothetical protein